MNLSRRQAMGLAAAVCVIGATRPALAAMAAFRPGLPPSAIRLECGASGHAYFRVDGLRDQVVLPGLDAGIAAVIPLAGREIVLISFGVAVPLGWLDLVAFVGWDNAALRVLGLELARCRGLDGGSVDTRISAVSDGARIRLTRESFMPRPPPLRGAFHEGWTDYLRWQDDDALADAPVRTPLPGTQQAKLSRSRTRVIAALSGPMDRRTLLIAPHLFNATGLLDPLGNDPPGIGQPGIGQPGISQPGVDYSASARLATLAR